MDFAFLPPELNSARMYSGPGSGALLAAAGSWDSLCAEVDTTAQVCESVLRGLTRWPWRGPAAEAMAATAAPYIGWLRTTAELAMQTAMHARAAAAAFQLAHAMTVPPTAVAANRVQLAALIATNFFGQNTAAIAAAEAQYAEFWAQDTAAMYGYAASSAAATQLAPFSSPSQTTSPGGETAQHTAVARAVNSLASNASAQGASGGSQTAPSNPIVAADSTFLDGAVALFASTDNMANLESFPIDIIGAGNNLGTLPIPATAAATDVAPLTAAPQLTGTAGLGNVTVAFGRADSIGSMSAPASWTAPSSGPVTPLSGSSCPELTASAEKAGSGSSMPGIPGMRPASRATLVVPRYGVLPKMMARHPYAG
jgi:PPE-repeat protein